MTKLSVFVLAFSALVASNAAAQSPPIDHWGTQPECEAAIESPWYVPSTTSNRSLNLKKEVMLPHPSGACFEIDLPDRITEGFPKRGRGWVRMPAGTQVVYSLTSHEPLRVGKCDNKIYTEAAFGNGDIPTNPFQVMQKTEVTENLSPNEASRLNKAREDWDKFQRRAERDNVSSSHHWYSTTPAKVGVAAILVTGVACALTPNHCALVRQTTKVCVNSVCDGK